jgi:hypothetical protein
MISGEKNIMVLTDCSHGALDAGRFAGNYLFDENSKIILLQTYLTTVQGKTVLNTISPMLEKVARRELNELRARLSIECNIDKDRIETRVKEGELKNVIIDEFGEIENFSIVAGAISESSPNKIPCRNIISALIDCNIHPVFLISDIITLIEDSRILLIAGNENKIPSKYLDYLRDLGGEKGKTLEVITENNRKQCAMKPESFYHFSPAMGRNKDKLVSKERLFYDRVFAVSPEIRK